MLPLLLLLLSPLAEAGGAHVLGAGGGRDYASDQFFVGADYTFHPDRIVGFAPLVRVAPSFGFTDELPMVPVELGLSFAPKRPDAPEIIRGGVIVSGNFLATRLRLPWEFGENDEGTHYGVIPAVELMVEFGYGQDKPRNFVFGVRAGVGSGSTNIFCDDPQSTGCVAWTPVFAGGFYGRGMLTTWGLYGELIIGISPRATLGYKF